jgi:hypothetical protein
MKIRGTMRSLRSDAGEHCGLIATTGTGFHVCCVLTLLGLISACAPTVPREQLQRVSTAYDAVTMASGNLLTELSVAERRNFIEDLPDNRSLREQNLVVPLQFNAKDAGYYGTMGDPVLTASLRRGLRVTGGYFKLLTILAEGQGIDQAQAQISALASSVGAIAALGTGGAAAPIVGVVVSGLQPLVRRWAEAKDVAELRRLVLEGAPKVDELLEQLQASSNSIYRTLISQPSNAAEGPLRTDKAARRAVLLTMSVDVAMVANFVNLVTALREALAALVSAVREPGSGVTLEALSASSNELLVQAQTAVRSVEIIRASGGMQ